MGLAPVAYCLWQRFLRYDPAEPGWPDRDRFVLSAGHASMLLYSLLYLAGVGSDGSGVASRISEGSPGGNSRPDTPRPVTLDEIRNFRQLGSACPGHPEYGLTTGVETTTGPLGQGVGTSVGMAIAGRWLAARYNRPGAELFGYNVYAIASDGDLMEGICAEAASLAGHLRLSNLCWLYDNNGVTIEGGTDLAFSDDVDERFSGHGWEVARVNDANDLTELTAALEVFSRNQDRPTLVIVDSHMAYGAPNKQDSSAAHGAPLGEEEVRLTKRSYGWPEESEFLVPDGVREHFAGNLGERGRRLSSSWRLTLERYRAEHPELAEELRLMSRRGLPEGWNRDLPTYQADSKGIPGRMVSGEVLNRVSRGLPWLLGGSSDLGPSNKTRIDESGSGDLSAENPGGRNVHFGIREHAMGAILNGMTLCGLRPYGATFLVFSDYARPAIRLSALMGQPVVYVFTHDSISLGEDGPTHQPVEHLAALRAMPGLVVLRPADANEVVEAWRVVLEMRDRPAALVLTRQPLPTFDRDRMAAPAVRRGAYVLSDSGSKPDVILIGTGSEVALCVGAQSRLKGEGVSARVVSMPSWELFEDQSADYRESVLPPEMAARVTVEQAVTFGWERYAGSEGEMLGIDTFGESAPGAELREKYGFSVESVVAAARRQLSPEG
jgi:transketolase